MRYLALALLLLAGCAASGAATGQVINAAANTALAAGVSGARRSSGECYTPCTPGNVCNPKTGTCDPIPCRGECRQDERCDESGVLPRCVAGAELEVRQSAAPAAPPADVPAAGK